MFQPRLQITVMLFYYPMNVVTLMLHRDFWSNWLFQLQLLLLLYSSPPPAHFQCTTCAGLALSYFPFPIFPFPAFENIRSVITMGEIVFVLLWSQSGFQLCTAIPFGEIKHGYWKWKRSYMNQCLQGNQDLIFASCSK